MHSLPITGIVPTALPTIILFASSPAPPLSVVIWEVQVELFLNTQSTGGHNLDSIFAVGVLLITSLAGPCEPAGFIVALTLFTLNFFNEFAIIIDVHFQLLTFDVLAADVDTGNNSSIIQGIKRHLFEADRWSTCLLSGDGPLQGEDKVIISILFRVVAAVNINLQDESIGAARVLGIICAKSPGFRTPDQTG